LTAVKSTKLPSLAPERDCCLFQPYFLPSFYHPKPHFPQMNVADREIQAAQRQTLPQTSFWCMRSARHSVIACACVRPRSDRDCPYKPRCEDTREIERLRSASIGFDHLNLDVRRCGCSKRDEHESSSNAGRPRVTSYRPEQDPDCEKSTCRNHWEEPYCKSRESTRPLPEMGLGKPYPPPLPAQEGVCG
jgi:hypothetical protein